MSDYYSIIFLLGGIQGFILAIFLFNQKKNLIAYRILGFLTLSWGVILVAFGLQFDNIFRTYPHLLGTFSRLNYLVFPLLFLYIKYLVRKYKRFNRIDLLHFTPFLLSILVYMDFYLQSAEDKLILLQSIEGYYYTVDLIGEEVMVVQGIVYSILAILLLKRYRREIQHHQSNTDKVLIVGSFYGIIILLISWIIGAIAVNLAIFNIEVSVDLFIFVYLLIVIIIYWISYYAIKSPEIFKLDRRELYPSTDDILTIEKSDDDTTTETKPNIWSDKEIEAMNNNLVNYIEKNRPYQEPNLSLQDLSTQLNMSRHHLSALINQKQKKNFYEFINTYRIEEVKNLIVDPENKDQKIMSLAYDAGFNSKASFNRIFKQFTNMTPSQYQELSSEVVSRV